ncbi:DUF6279 family lipoprotein [Pseudomonas alabamensis]|uniref:DUF6279 family lipoprotein n=1 Tax=Pseudomonas alabamensis TaxID=3064349 RepID=UPI000745CE53|nr:hypothetical protein APT63_05520 [Pseudomonas monteilii]
MPTRLSLRLRALLLTVLVLSSLAACSRIDLAYRNLDVLVPWSLNDYLDMDREQKRWLDQRLHQHLAWHCQTQLPGYLHWLDRVRTMVAQNAVTDAALRQRTEEAREAIGRVAEAITPSATELLAGLSDAQVGELREAFAKDIRERRAEYVDTPLAQQIDERAERMEKRLKPWLGALSPAQHQRVVQWSQALGDQNRAWITNRAEWQQQLLSAVEQRQTPGFAARMAQLLQHKDSLWTPAYRQAFEQTETQARSLMVDLLQDSSPEQRQRLQNRLDKVRQDFSALKCLKEA